MQENRQSQTHATGSGGGFHAGSSGETRGSSTGDRTGNGGVLNEVLDSVTNLPATARPEERTEGSVARMIEAQTSKLPSDTFLWAAVGAMATSAVCELTGLKDKSRFFGQWVAPLLLFGVYNKLVKVHGHDELHRQ